MDLVEADIWWYRGRLEVRHLKTMGPIPVLWDRWKLTSARAPRLLLDDLVRAAAPGTELMLDLKGSKAEPPGGVMETMERLAPGRRYTVSSQWWALLEPFREQEHVRVVHSIGSARQLRALPRWLGSRPADAVAINHRLLSPERARRLCALAPERFAWSVRTSDRLRELVDRGITGVITEKYRELFVSPNA